MGFSKEKKRILKDTSQYTASNFLVQFIGIVMAIVVRRGLGPAMMGMWALLKVVLQYSFYSDMGISAVAYRDIPFQLGKNNKAEATKIQNVCFTYTIAVSIMIAVLLFAWSMFKAGIYPVEITTGLRVIAFIFILMSVYNFYINLMRAYKNFSTLSQVIVINALFGLIFAVLLVPKFKITGMFMTVCLSLVLSSVFIFVRTKYSARFSFDRKIFFKMLNAGVPIFLAGIGFSLLLSIDKIMIAKYLGFKEVGFYTIASISVITLYTIPKSFGIVVFPRMQEHFAQVEDVAKLGSYLLKPIQTISSIMPLFIGVSYFIVPILVQFFLPKYIQGTQSFKMLMCGVVFICIAFPSSLFLITIHKQRRLTVMAFGVVAMAVVMMIFAIHQGFGLIGVSFAMSVAYLLYFLVLTIESLRNILAPIELFKSILTVLASSVYFIGCMVGLDILVKQSSPALKAAACISLFLLLSGIFLFFTKRKELGWLMRRGD